MRNYYVLCLDEDGTIYNQGPFTWDDAVNAMYAVVTDTGFIARILCVDEVIVWATEVLEDAHYG